MSDELPELALWILATGSQGEPIYYSKQLVESGAKILFDAYSFKAGKSQRERRRSFEDVWDESGSEPWLVAYGFDAALRHRIYSISYVKACIRNFISDMNRHAPEPEVRKAPPVADPIKQYRRDAAPAPPKDVKTPRKTKAKVEESKEAEVDWS